MFASSIWRTASACTDRGFWLTNSANGFSGGTVLHGGELDANAAHALGTGPLSISGGTLANTSGAALTLSPTTPNIGTPTLHTPGPMT